MKQIVFNIVTANIQSANHYLQYSDDIVQWLIPVTFLHISGVISSHEPPWSSVLARQRFVGSNPAWPKIKTISGGR